MSQSWNHDPAIRVTIHTPTSTRRPPPRPVIEFRTNLPINTYDDLLLFYNRNVMEMIRQRSLQEQELKRNDNVQLDIESRRPKPAEIGQNCTICCGPIENTDMVCTLDNCRHTFHHRCIDEWGKYKPICPICRNNIPTI